jgi:hypothetical protein
MGRRGNGEGSITRRNDGLYMARYTVETATGAKRKAKARSSTPQTYAGGSLPPSFNVPVFRR